MTGRPNSEGLFAAVRRRLGLAVICALLVPAAAYGISKTVEPQYKASATLLFREPPFQDGLPGLSVVIRSTEASRELSTNLALASLDVVAQRTARRVRGGVSKQQVSDDVDISVKGETDVAVVVAKARRAALAAKLANAFAREFIAFRRRTDLRRIRRAEQRVEGELAALEQIRSGVISRTERRARRQALRRRARSLQLLAAAQSGRAEVVEPAAAPTSPFSPKTRTNVAVGGALGLLLGLSLALFVDRLDRRLRNSSEAERALDAPIIGSIPRSNALSSEPDQLPLSPTELEPFDSLWASLRYIDTERKLNSILVTSASRGDGRTTTALHLAAAAAESGTRVLLLEADFRRPRLQQLLGLSDKGGLARALTSQSDLSEVIQSVELPGGIRMRANGDSGQRVIDVIAAGPTPSNPSGAVASQRMRELLSVAQERYEVVVVDAPPLIAVADAVPLVPAVSGSIVVVRVRHTARRELFRLAERLNHLRARTLGVVVNQAERPEALHGQYIEEPRSPAAIPAR